MRRCVVIAALALGCCRAGPPAVPDVVVAPPAESASPAPPPADPPAKPAPPKTPDPAPTAFTFPADLAGKELPKVVAPSPVPPPPAERFGAEPLARTPPAKVVSPDALPKTRYALPPVLPAPAAGAVPSPPRERVPPDPGRGSAAVPARPVLPVSPVDVPKARDVNRPPPLPPLGRRVPDRASLDDPTAEPANAAIVNRSPVPALDPAPFLKVTIPDPFELGAQVKPKTDPAAEPNTAPVPVNPRRPK